MPIARLIPDSETDFWRSRLFQAGLTGGAVVTVDVGVGGWLWNRGRAPKPEAARA